MPRFSMSFTGYKGHPEPRSARSQAAGLLLLAGFIASALVACAHTSSLDDGVLRVPGMTAHLGPVPPGWRRIRVDGADLAFRDEQGDASVLVDARCGVKDDDAPLSVLTEHLIMGTTERRVGAQDVIPFDGREAMHTLLVAKLDGVAMQYDIYVTKKDGCVADIVYVAAPDRFAQGVAGFDRFVAGLHISSGDP